MSEFLPDTQAEIERVLLWQDIVDIFHANEDRLGVQLDLADTPLAPRNGHTRLVLEETYKDSVAYTIRLWATMDRKAIIGSVVLLYIDDEGTEVFNYNLTPNNIEQYSKRPTALDRGDLMSIRLDLREAEWDAEASSMCAEEFLLLD